MRCSVSIVPHFVVSLICASCGPHVFAQTTDRPEEVITVASRVERDADSVGNAVTVIDAAEISERGYWSVTDLLRTQPGIGVSNAGGGGKVSALRIRGEEAFRTLIRIDGIDIADPSSTQVAPIVEHLASSQALSRIEILRGSHGFIYGADAGGVIALKSRAAVEPFDGSLGLDFGADGARRVDADFGRAGERTNLLLAITDAQADGFNSRIEDQNPADDDGFQNTTIHAKASFDLAEQAGIELVLRDVDAAFEFDQCGFPMTHDCYGETEQTSLRLAASWDSKSTTNSFSYATTETDRFNLADGVTVFATAGTLGRLEYTGSAGIGRTVFVYGLDIEREEVEPAGAGVLSSRQRAAYFELQRRVGQNLHWTVGARRDSNDDFGRHTSARVSLSYLQAMKGGAELRYRASAGTGFRAPSLSEIAYNAGPFAFPPAVGTTLRQESVRGYDLGLELTTVDGARYELGYFDQDIDDEIFFDLIGFSGYLQALGTGHSRGFELIAQVPLGQRWQILGNALINETRAVDGNERIRRPETTVNLGFRFLSGDQRFSAYANYRIVRDSEDEVFGLGRLPLDNYGVLDLSGTLAVNDRVELFARAENLLDEDYVELVGFRTAGRSLYAGARFKF